MSADTTPTWEQLKAENTEASQLLLQASRVKLALLAQLAEKDAEIARHIQRINELAGERDELIEDVAGASTELAEKDKRIAELEGDAALRDFETLAASHGMLERRIGELASERTAAETEAAKLREALEEIAIGRGAFSLDHLQHAKNCIENMKAVAIAALTPTAGETLARPTHCPACESPNPRFHPALSAEGEVTHICPDAWHSAGETTEQGEQYGERYQKALEALIDTRAALLATGSQTATTIQALEVGDLFFAEVGRG